ncbi:MAG TPA: di-trans,poly-cis-decaprenylcistransferase [Spongiibacteraceae bacterium]|nr:di-trans,poly-cis-decaprenylcistransferase [Spongiibacteraceae bacterium]MBN48421.1 di-trans,poly-cis-decaprenylcistransferase [Spongiibacteraceae bacterium]HCS27278.1 di-trans,poly-cis-decaprenylcistransferase [Spongiibacteraceae bacterium]|tara:strand:- start:9 stop:773 length:765 start_codon:yes stop_codon:yes gene_type:complete
MSFDPHAAEQAAPRHVAIIMDGNNRWAKHHDLKPYAGHRAGVEVIRNVLDEFQKAGVGIVTLFAFSSENWKRPSAEVNALMTLFSNYLDSEIRKLNEDQVRLRFIGRRDRLSNALLKKMDYAEQSTRLNRKTSLNIALDYGGQWDIAESARQLARRVERGELKADDINEQMLADCLSLCNLPDPDLCIRTAGENRISNFMLWQLAYSEFYFSQVLWPDFDATEVRAALKSYAERERRYGGRLTQPENSEGSHFA